MKTGLTLNPLIPGNLIGVVASMARGTLRVEEQKSVSEVIVQGEVRLD